MENKKTWVSPELLEVGGEVTESGRYHDIRENATYNS
jgi:hypothetical protein